MAVPYALWWLVMIETVALAAEEAHEPHRTIPRGLVWGAAHPDRPGRADLVVRLRGRGVAGAGRQPGDDGKA